MSKECKECGLSKSFGNFPIESRKKDGRGCRCRECESIRRHKRYIKSKDKALAQQREKYKNDLEYRQRRKDYQKRYKKANPDKLTAWGKAYRERNPKVNIAYLRTAAYYHAHPERKSTICSDCGDSNSKIEAHHKDYSKPLDITWLCSLCHRKEHGRAVDAG